MTFRFRKIKNWVFAWKHSCPNPPYLIVEVTKSFPFIQMYFGGLVCICDIVTVLEELCD
jgi:hypothetical protein